MIEAAFLQCRADKSWNQDLWQITSCHCNSFTLSFRPTSLFVHQHTWNVHCVRVTYYRESLLQTKQRSSYWNWKAYASTTRRDALFKAVAALTDKAKRIFGPAITLRADTRLTRRARACFPFTKETQFNFKTRPNTHTRINGIARVRSSTYQLVACTLSSDNCKPPRFDEAWRKKISDERLCIAL